MDSKVSAEGRKDLLEWLSKKLSGINDSSDSIQLLKPACSALTVYRTIWLEFFLAGIFEHVFYLSFYQLFLTTKFTLGQIV